MGGWVTAMTAADTVGLKGTILISAANMGELGKLSGPRRPALVDLLANSLESLSNTNPEAMADELISRQAEFDWATKAQMLARTPLLVLSSDDGLGPSLDVLVESIRNTGGAVTSVHVPTDHVWSDNRLRLQAEVIRWLEGRK